MSVAERTRLPDCTVSVVMAVHNDAAYLEAAIRSVLDQADVDLELVIIDDASTDESPTILDRARTSDPRVRVHTRQVNEGLTAALILGCSLARGRYIARQDADDESLPGRLRQQSALLDRLSDVAFVSTWSQAVGPRGELLFTEERPHEPDKATDWLVRRRVGPPGHGTVMFRKDAYDRVGGYRSLFPLAQDIDLWVRLAMVGQLAYVPEVLYRYRIQDDSISTRNGAARQAYRQLVNQLHAARRDGLPEEPIIASANLPTLRTAATASTADKAHSLYFIASCLLQRRDRRALRYLTRSLALMPTQLRAWARLPSAVMVALTGRADDASTALKTPVHS